MNNAGFYKKKIVPFFLFFSFLCPYTLPAQTKEEVLLIQNMENKDALPKRFRTSFDEIKATAEVPNPVVTGLGELRVSGSGQFSYKSLQEIQKKLNYPKKLHILDLRQESHGFINGIAVSWYAYKDWENIGKMLHEIQTEEKKRLVEILQQGKVTLQKVMNKNGFGLIQTTEKINVQAVSVATEDEIVRSFNLCYTRIPVTDHVKPSDADVDAFIAFVRHLPEDAWLHIHCAAGKGRTTTFMVLYDMMHNAKQVSLSDILDRHWLLGGLCFDDAAKASAWKSEQALDRADFVKAFYEYCRTNEDDYNESWSRYTAARLKPRV